MELAIIVEGHAEMEVLPILLRRIFSNIDPQKIPKFNKKSILRIPKGSLLKEGGIEKAARTISIRLSGDGAILLLLDSDGSCPAALGPELLSSLRRHCGHLVPSVVIAHHEYENWFIHSIKSLANRNDIRDGIEIPAEPDKIQDAKGWISRCKVDGKYSEILDQPKLSAAMDLEEARRSDSFDKLYREMEKISEAIE